MKKILLSSLSALLIAGCCQTGNLTGTWVQPVPGLEGQMQGITLKEGGEAASVNMATLVYEKWSRNGDELTLEGKSIGNGQTIDFKETYKITRLTDGEMTLSVRGNDFMYTRQR